MRISEAFASKYVGAIDLHGREITVTISHVVTEELQNDRGPEYKPVIYFQGAAKGMILNKTNAATVSSVFGDETDAWAGRQLVLFTVKTQNRQGQMVDGIRCRCVHVAPAGNGGAFATPPTTLGSAAPVTPAADDPLRPSEGGELSKDINDDIPF